MTDLEKWFQQWADQCKTHNFGLVEAKLRDVLAEIERLRTENAEMRASLGYQAELRDSIRHGP